MQQGAMSRQSEAGQGEPVLSLCSALLEYIGSYVLSGESPSDARTDIGGFRDSLSSELSGKLSSEELAEIQERVRNILADHQTEVQDAASRAAVETRHLAAILDQAVALLTNGEERSLSGLQKIQEALQRTSRLPDLVSLRKSLKETIRLANEESARQKTESAREIAAFRTEVVEAQELVAHHPNQRLGGRPEGVRSIAESLQALAPDHALYAVVFVFDQLNAVLQRYGPEAVDEMMFRLIRERIQPLAALSSAFRWTPQSLVGIFQRPRGLDSARSEAAALNRFPLVQRISLGNRTAVLTLSPSHLVVEADAAQPESLIQEIDLFTRANV
jgi:hypothetical protein